VAGVAVRIPLEVVLMLGLGFPERPAGVTSVTPLPGQRPEPSSVLWRLDLTTSITSKLLLAISPPGRRPGE
jgi:hypothetical protein